jgi:hypothetical protein
MTARREVVRPVVQQRVASFRERKQRSESNEAQQTEPIAAPFLYARITHADEATGRKHRVTRHSYMNACQEHSKDDARGRLRQSAMLNFGRSRLTWRLHNMPNGWLLSAG